MEPNDKVQNDDTLNPSDVNVAQEVTAVKQGMSALFGLDTLPQEQQDEALQKMFDLVMNETLMRTIESMTDEQTNAFNAFLEEQDRSEEEVFVYLSETIEEFSDVSEIVAFEMMDEMMAASFPGKVPAESVSTAPATPVNDDKKS